MMNKKYLNLISYIFLLVISYIVIFRTDKEELKNLLLEVGFINFILIIIIASSYLFFSSLKWSLIMKNFQVTKFKDSLFSFYTSASMSDFISNPILLDIHKFFDIKKKLTPKKKFFILLIDKLYTVSSKLLILLPAINLLNIYFYNFYTFQFLFISFVIIILILSIPITIDKIIKSNLFKKFKRIKKFFVFFKLTIKNYFSVLTLDLFRNLVHIIVHSLCLGLFFSGIDLFKLIILVQIIDLLIRFNFLPNLGTRELITILIANLAAYSNEKIILATLITTLVFYIGNYLNVLFAGICKYRPLRKL